MKTKEPFQMMFDKQKMLSYCEQTLTTLQLENEIETQIMIDFIGYVHSLEKCEVFRNIDSDLQYTECKLDELKLFKNMNSTLSSITHILCSKFVKSILINSNFEKACDLKNSSVIFDTTSYLVKKFLGHMYKEYPDFIEELLNYFYYFFNQYNLNSNSHDFYNDEMLYIILKLLSKFIDTFSILRNDKMNETIVNVIAVLPFNSLLTVKCFVNFITPTLSKFSVSSVLNNVLKKTWVLVCTEFQNNYYDFLKYSNFYILLYNISKQVFSIREQNSQLLIHKDILFWKIIQIGLISEASYIKKIAANIFKMFLLWAKDKKEDLTVHDTCNNSVIFSLDFKDGVKVWDDVVIIFETLEEKQIHVIKPVLPKIVRIVLLTGQCDEKYILHSSWMTTLFCRLLNHESRYIVKWGLDYAFRLDYNLCTIIEQNSEEFIKLIIAAINEQNLFSRISEQDNFAMFLSSEKITVFLANYLTALKEQTEKVKFLKTLIRIISLQSWSIVPLLHLISALSKLSSIAAWEATDLLHIKKIISDCQQSQEKTFRTVLENLFWKCCFLFLDWNLLNLNDIADLLMIFKSLRNLQNSNIWFEFCLQLQQSILNKTSAHLDVKEVKLFCEQEIKKIFTFHLPDSIAINYFQIKKFSRIFILLSDAKILIYQDNFSTKNLTLNCVLNQVLLCLKNADKRPYMLLTEFLSSLQLITCIMKEKNRNCKEDCLLPVIECFQEFPEISEFIFQTLFFEVEDKYYIYKVKTIFTFLEISIYEPNLRCFYYKAIPTLIEKCHNVIKNHQLAKLLLIPLWTFVNNLYLMLGEDVSDSGRDSLKSLNYLVICEVIQNNMLQECLLVSLGPDEIEASNNFSFVENSVCQFWSTCMKVVQHSLWNEQVDLILQLVDELSTALVNGPKATIPYAIQCFQFLSPKLENQDLMYDILHSSWRTCLELRGNEAFRPAVCSLIKTVYLHSMLQEPHFPILYDYFEKFKTLSENTLGIFFHFINQFCDTFSIKILTESKFNYSPVLVEALTFGLIHNKYHKVFEDTLLYIMEDDYISFLIYDNNIRPSIYVRIKVIDYLLSQMHEKDEFNESFALNIINGLLNIENEQLQVRSARFSNSLSHRIRNRAWQIICLLQPYIIHEDSNKKFLLMIFDCLELKAQQPSIRYLQEWIMFNIVQTHSALLETYLSYFIEISDKRPSCVISLISVLCLLISHKSLVSEQHILKCFPLLIIQCMAQNFTVRLYAQMTLIKLFHFCQERNLKNALNKYEFVINLIEAHEYQAENGNFSRNIEKLTTDFFYTSFDPVSHFSLETIFYELPRLSNLPPDEWIKPSFFNTLCENVVPIYNSDDSLKNSLPTHWSSKSFEESNFNKSDSFDFNFQKKICPLKDLTEIVEPIPELIIENKNCDKSGLIVVASLIDRAPNLGGLCRTCEIFGIQELVIGSLHFTEDKQFQTLAVSSDKWVPIKEVKPYLLKDYLISMKNQGYVLVGAEQTENSCYLQNFTFPTKCVLLLGHEKEGLPIDLIQLLDNCVEIPQQGVVRSLNVHVTGAILIWEYARQNLNRF